MKSGESKNYDTVVIEGFVSMYVKNVIASERVISNGLVESGAGSDYANLDLSIEANKNREITIIKDGAGATFADIKTGTVIDVAKSESAIKIIISDKKASIVVSGKSVDEFGDSYIYDAEGGEYLLADELVNSTTVKVPGAMHVTNKTAEGLRVKQALVLRNPHLTYVFKYHQLGLSSI